MNEQLLSQVVAIIIVVSVTSSLCIIIAASIYDIRVITKRRHLQRAVTSLRRTKNQPHVTIIIMADNNEQEIIQCLGSVLRSRYHNYDVVVVDNISTDGTWRALERYVHAHSNRPVRLLAATELQSWPSRMSHAFYASGHGEIVIVIDGAAVISPMLLRQSVAHFMTDNQLLALQVNVSSGNVRTIETMIRRATELSYQLFCKATSLVNLRATRTDRPNMIYRQSVLKTIPPTRYVAAHYDGLIGIERLRIGTRSESRPTILTVFLSVLAIVGMTYFFYTTATTQSATYLTLTWLALVIWLMTAIWSDAIMKRTQKVLLTFCTPIFYFALYGHLLIGAIKLFVRQR